MFDLKKFLEDAGRNTVNAVGGAINQASKLPAQFSANMQPTVRNIGGAVNNATNVVQKSMPQFTAPPKFTPPVMPTIKPFVAPKIPDMKPLQTGVQHLGNDIATGVKNTGSGIANWYNKSNDKYIADRAAVNNVSVKDYTDPNSEFVKSHPRPNEGIDPEISKGFNDLVTKPFDRAVAQAVDLGVRTNPITQAVNSAQGKPGFQFKPDNIITPKNDLEKFVFGDQPVRNIESRAQNNINGVEGAGVPKIAAVPLGLAGTALAFMGDITPVPTDPADAANYAGKAITHASNARAAAGVANKLGLNTDPTTIKNIINAKTTKDAAKVLADNAATLFANAKNAQGVKSVAKMTGTKVDKSIINNLVSETDPARINNLLNGNIPISQTAKQTARQASDIIAGKAKVAGGKSGLLESAQNTPVIPKGVIAVDPAYSVKHNQDLWKSGGDKLRELGDDGAHQFMVENNTDEGVATGWRLFEKRLSQGDKEGAQQLLSDMAMKAIESGRQTQAWSMIKRLDPKYMAMRVERSVQQFTKAHPHLAGLTNWGPETQQRIITQATNIADDNFINKIARSGSLKSITQKTGITNKGILKELVKSKDPERIKGLLMVGMQQDIHSVIPSTLGDKALTAWRAALLSKPATHIRNLVGNTVNTAAESIVTPLASVFDRTIGRALTPTKNTITSTLRSSKGTWGKALQDTADSYRFGAPIDEAGGKYGLREINWNTKYKKGFHPIYNTERTVEKLLKPTTNFVYRTLGAEDKMFKTPAVATAMYNMADAAAHSAGVAGKSKAKWMEKWILDAPMEIRNQALKEGGAKVFQKETAVSNFITGGKKALENHGMEGAAKALDYIQPFVNVPAAIGSELLTYTPLGLGRVANKAMKAKTGRNIVGKVMQGGDSPIARDIARREAMKDLAKVTVGGGVIGAGMAAGYKGDATGDRPIKGTKEYSQWQLENKQPNAIKVGLGKAGDYWANINSLGPQTILYNAAANTGANTLRAENKTKPMNILDKGLNFAGNVGSAFMDTSSLTGLSDATNVITEPSRYLQGYVGRQITSPIPNIIKGIGASMDPYNRETNNTLESIQANIPGARNLLTPQRDVQGNMVKNNAYGWAGMKAQFDPLNLAKSQTNPITQAYGETGATPTALKQDLKAYGQDMKLTPEQLNVLEQQSAKNLNMNIEQLINTPEYKAADKQNKADAISKTTSNVRANDKNNFAVTGAAGTNTASTGNAGTGIIDTSKIVDGAITQLKKDQFEKSGKNYLVDGNTVYRRDAQGNVIAQPKVKFDYQVGQAKLKSQKDDGDINGWMKTAQGQLDSVMSQLQDNSIDPLDAQTLQNEAQTLVDDMAKYKSYGGFKKGSSGSGSSSKLMALMKADNSATTTGNTYKYLQSLLGTTKSNKKATKVALKQIKGA